MPMFQPSKNGGFDGHILDLHTAVKDGVLGGCGGGDGKIVVVVADEKKKLDLKKMISELELPEVPSVFICPISLEPMQDPVTLCTGQTYERSNILKWFNLGHCTCPTTMQELWDDLVTPNNTLHQLIYTWFSQKYVLMKKRSEDVQGRAIEILGALRKAKGKAKVHALSELNQVVLAHAIAKKTVVDEGGVFVISSLLSLSRHRRHPTYKIRTHSIRRAHENIDKALKAAEVILDQFDLTRKAEAKILRGPHEDLESYLEAIDQLRGTIKFFSNNKMFKSASGVISHAHGLLSKALSKLEDEFRQILQNYSKPMEPDRLFECLPSNLRPSSEGESGGGKNHDPHQKSLENAIFTVPTVIPPRVLPLLHDLAQQMVQAGHQQQLFKSYRDTRAAVLEQSLKKLGVERLSKDDVQRMQWEVLEAKIGNWIHYMRISVKLLFAAEKKICDQILDGVESLRDQCFGEVTVNSVAVLLSFGEAIAKSKRSPEKLFVLLDMYEIMRELQPEIELLFGEEFL